MAYDPNRQVGWDEVFMRHAYLISSKSKDKRTKIGAVIVRDKHVISEGYNGMPIGVNDDLPERHERPEKYFWFEHGERNAVFSCARFGISCLGGVMYTQGIPCADCSRAVIQGGLSEVVVHAQWQSWEKQFGWEKWIQSAERSKKMFEEAGIKIRVFDLQLDLNSLLDGKQVSV